MISQLILAHLRLGQQTESCQNQPKTTALLGDLAQRPEEPKRWDHATYVTKLLPDLVEARPRL